MIMTNQRKKGGGNPKHPEALECSQSGTLPCLQMMAGRDTGRGEQGAGFRRSGEAWERRKKKRELGVWDRSMGLKGGAIETDEEEFPEITYSNISDEYDVNFPRHLIIKSDSFARRHVFIRSKVLQHRIGADSLQGMRIKVASDPNEPSVHYLEVSVATAKQADILLRTKKLGEDEVTVIKHPKKNLLYGVFYDEQDMLTKVPDVELLKGFQEYNQGIVKVEKLGKVGKMWKVTYEANDLPRRIIVGLGTVYRVDKFIPQPLRCYKCQKYGHTTKSCHKDNPFRCQRCSMEFAGPHDSAKCKAKQCDCSHCYKTCKANEYCFICKGPHSAGSKDCPEQKFQKDINFFMYRKDLPRKEAVRQAQVKRDGTTYTSVLASHQSNRQPDPAQVAPGVSEVTEKLGDRLSSLENMFKKFLDTMAGNNSEQEAATPTIAALKTSLEQQQSQINDLQTSYETQRKIFEDTEENI